LLLLLTWIAVPGAVATRAAAAPEADEASVAAAAVETRTRAYTLYLGALQLSAAGDTQAAMAELRRVIELDPDAPYVRATLARMCLREGDESCAAEQARRAVAQSDEQADGHKVLAEIALGRFHRTQEPEDLEAALRHLGQAAAAEPLDPGVWVAWIRVLGSTGRMDEAEEVAARAASVPGLDPAIPWLTLSRLLVARGEQVRAVRLLSEVEATGRGAVPLLEALAELQGQTGDLPGQADTLRRLRQLRPDDPTLPHRLGLVLLELADPYAALEPLEAALAAEPADAVARRDLALALVQLGRGADALPLLEELPPVYRDPRGLHLWARAAEQAGRWSLAATRLEELLDGLDRGDPDSPARSVRLQAARNWLRAGEPARAAALLETGAGTDAVELRLALEALRALGREAEAERVLAARLDERPDDVGLVVLAAEQQADVGHPDQALETLLAALPDGDQRTTTAMAMARALAQWDHPSLAARLLDAVMPAQPSSDVLRLRAGVLHAAGRLGEAEAAYRRLLELEPEDHTALNDLGYLLATDGRDLDEAIRMLKRAVAAQPSHPAYLDSLGYALHRSGRSEEALPLLREAARRAREHQLPEIREHLGDVYFALGQTDRALAEWRASLELGDGDEPRLVEKLRRHAPEPSLDGGRAEEP
jgi:tetratricopeptide (TPR) repeat protein